MTSTGLTLPKLTAMVQWMRKHGVRRCRWANDCEMELFAADAQPTAMTTKQVAKQIDMLMDAQMPKDDDLLYYSSELVAADDEAKL